MMCIQMQQGVVTRFQQQEVPKVKWLFQQLKNPKRRQHKPKETPKQEVQQVQQTQQPAASLPHQQVQPTGQQSIGFEQQPQYTAPHQQPQQTEPWLNEPLPQKKKTSSLPWVIVGILFVLVLALLMLLLNQSGDSGTPVPPVVIPKDTEQEETIITVTPPVVPPMMGACCVEGECQVETRDDCDARTGEYKGDTVECENNPCVSANQPRGDCAIEGGGLFFKNAERVRRDEWRIWRRRKGLSKCCNSAPIR